MSTLVVVGACYLDTILTVPHYPKEDEKLRAVSLSKRRGGNGPNTLEVLQQFIGGHPEPGSPSLALCSILPSASSAAVEQIKESLGPAIDMSTCIYREAYTEAASSYIIASTGSGTRTIVNYNNLPEMTLAEFQNVTSRIDARKAWYHFEGRIPEITLECLKYLRQQYPGTTISVEIEKPGRHGLQALASEADVVFYSQSWAKNKGYVTAKECLQEQSVVTDKASLLFCTWGSSGSAAFQRATGKIFEAPAFKLSGRQLIDSTGAGDAFIAAALFPLISKEIDINSGPLIHKLVGMVWFPELLQFANEIAGRKVIQDGFDGLGRYGKQYHLVKPTKFHPFTGST